MTPKISRFTYVIFYADVITVNNTIHRILRICPSCASMTRLGSKWPFYPSSHFIIYYWPMVNEKNTIRQMTPIFDYILISELVSLNTRSSLFIYPLLARQDVILNFMNSISMNPITLSWLSHFPNIRDIVPTWVLTH